MCEFKDYFSKQASSYAVARPKYPDELFDFLSSLTSEHEVAWDCGTGNGQAAISLTRYFKAVLATDASWEQINKAFAHEKVNYRVCRSEESEIAGSSVDLITAAAALHWFNLDKFYPEACRILKKGGAIAAWSYSFLKINDQLDAIIHHLAHNLLKDFWPKENRLVWDKYVDLSFPFEVITPPEFQCKNYWNLFQLKSYLSTWSSTQRYISAKNSDPLQSILEDLRRAWGDPEEQKEINWELAIKVGKNR